jgi:hypothetical protein
VVFGVPLNMFGSNDVRAMHASFCNSCSTCSWVMLCAPSAFHGARLHLMHACGARRMSYVSLTLS